MIVKCFTTAIVVRAGILPAFFGSAKAPELEEAKIVKVS
jgi:hypothetical protein